MLVVTGGAGFIGSALLWKLNQLGATNLVVIDDLGSQDKWRNIAKRQIVDVVSIDKGVEWLRQHHKQIDAVFHMGACSTTTELDADFLFANNVHYSMRLFEICAAHEIPLIYASSAATYGNGELGYSDDPGNLSSLRPINKYGYSKFFFDQWVMQQKQTPPMCVGLKFFNVYGPQEYHKGGQASVVYHAFPQICDRKVLRLFKSYRDDVGDGEQKRDFIYVKDVVELMGWLYEHQAKKKSGIYNVGTGTARSFIDLGTAVFTALDQPQVSFDFIEMPESLRSQYQYYTAADLSRLRKVCGYSKEFTSLEDGVRDYVQGYLLKEDSFL